MATFVWTPPCCYLAVCNTTKAESEAFFDQFFLDHGMDRDQNNYPTDSGSFLDQTQRGRSQVKSYTLCLGLVG